MFKLFDLSLQLGGFPIHRAKKKLESIVAISELEFERYTEKRKIDIVKFHLENNSFYRELAGSGNFSCWDDLPIMKKSDLQRPLSERLSDGFSNKIYVNKTSGSSGDPMVFAKDKFCHAMIWANIQRRFSWYGIDFNHSLQARFYGRTLDRIPGYLLQMKDFLSNRHRFDIFDLSDRVLENVVKQFAIRKFEYINGYTSSIVQLAKYLRKKDMRLIAVCPSLKVCITTSEMLFPDDRQLLETYLGIPIVNEYGASELEVIAFENPDGEWLLNTETIFVELLDENDQPVEDGHEGRIIVTSLDNKAHPFIRYEVGDRGIIESISPKKKILRKLSGRTNDFALLPSGKKPAGMTFYSITKKLFGDDGIVKEFVITQTAIDHFAIDYVSERQLDADEIAKIKNILSDYLEPGLKFQFTKRDALPRSGSGKLRQFTSMLPQTNT